MHIKDSMNSIGSHKDRHQKLGEGTIGSEAFKNIVTNKYIRNLPMLLETPNDIDGYAMEIKTIKSYFN